MRKGPSGSSPYELAVYLGHEDTRGTFVAPSVREEGFTSSDDADSKRVGALKGGLTYDDALGIRAAFDAVFAENGGVTPEIDAAALRGMLRQTRDLVRDAHPDLRLGR